MTDVDDVPVRTETADGVLTITMNRPTRKNAMNPAGWTGLHDALHGPAQDRDVRVVVLTGAGGNFCAGADLSNDRTEHPIHRLRQVNQIAMALHDLPVPTIAKVSGVAVGAGWNLALGCDLVVAERDARFSQIFTKRGVSVDLGGSWFLPKIVGLQQAKRIALLAEIIHADEAHRLGLVTYLVETGTIDAVVADLAKNLAAGAPVALAQTKALLNENADRTLHDALENEGRAQMVNFAGTDAPAAFSAFLDKREPVFTGGWNVG